ncbi:PspC domain-containing protein [Cellulomonas sp. P4]|uniref:PspC domain-containing protein n=1 Tax=Cellulomonas sp. P4 TaxID=3142533 RepID=UPI0031BBAC66
MTGIYEAMWRNGLVRPLDGRVLGGVCSGLARRFGMDAWPMRWLFVIVLIVLPGSPLLIYPLLWIFMPGEDWVARTHGPSAYDAAFPGSRPVQQPPYPPYQAQQPSAAQPDAGRPYPPAPGQGPQDPAAGPR